MMGNTLFAQDLEPRRWTPLPAGTNIVAVAYAHTSGDVNFNPVLEIEDTNVKRDTLILNYTRFFTLGDKLTRLDATVPLHNAKWDGLLRGEPATAEREGMGDPRFRLSVNLLGAPTAGSKVSKPNNTVVGAAIAVSVPWGQYYENKLLNLGSNRYTIRPQIGVVHTRGPWSYELTGSIFYFTDNNDFYNNSKLEQDPFYAAQAHIIRIFKPGVWGSLSAGYGKGGTSKVNSLSLNDKREGLISALSFGIPITRDQGLKFSYIWWKMDIPKDTLSDTGTFAFGWSLRF
jgi:hypothetical protein